MFPLEFTGNEINAFYLSLIIQGSGDVYPSGKTGDELKSKREPELSSLQEQSKRS